MIILAHVDLLVVPNTPIARRVGWTTKGLDDRHAGLQKRQCLHRGTKGRKEAISASFSRIHPEAKSVM